MVQGLQPKPEQDVIRQVSEANNFLSRAPRRHRTGRNVQLNVKVRPETAAQFTAMADEYHVVFGELLQQALDALKNENWAMRLDDAVQDQRSPPRMSLRDGLPWGVCVQLACRPTRR